MYNPREIAESLMFLISDCPLKYNKQRYECVIINFERLIHHIPADRMLIKLFSGLVLNQNDYDRLENKTIEDKNSFIVRKLILAGTNKSYDIFVQALKELNEKFLVGLLESDYIDEKTTQDN